MNTHISCEIIFRRSFEIMNAIAPATRIILLIITVSTLHSNAYAQKVSLNERNTSLVQVFNKIRAQTGYDFMFSGSAMKDTQKITINVRDMELKPVIDQILKDQPLDYKIEDKAVIISRKDAKTATPPTPHIAAQSIVIGKVENEKGEPLIGVNVTIKSPDITKKPRTLTLHDNQGQFILPAEPTDILQFSFVGYQEQEHLVSSLSQPAIIKMESAIGTLDEVQVIAYGTTSKRLNTGAVSSITSEDIAKQPISNPLHALQGRVAGAVVTQASGLPGAQVNILIRSATSLRAGTTPLYVIDGVPFNAGAPASLNGAGTEEVGGISAPSIQLSPFSFINPDDIERMDILKDADATAIFGTKGANGAVLITTKKAKMGRTSLDLNLQQGTGSVAHFVPVLSLPQYLAIRRKAYENDGLTPTSTTPGAADLFLWSQTEGRDWQKEYMSGTAQFTNLNATLQGGDVRTKMLLSTSYNRQTTVAPGDQYNQRLSTRLNVDHQSADQKFSANATVTYAYSNSDMARTDFAQYWNLSPNRPLYEPDGKLNWANRINPDASLLQRYLGKTNSFISALNLNYRISPDLELRLNGGYNRTTTNQNGQMPDISQFPAPDSPVPTHNASFGIIDNQFYSVEPQLNYRRTISKGSLNVLLGVTFQNTDHVSNSIRAEKYINAQLLGAIPGATNYRLTGSDSQYKYNSVFARATYNWEQKYIFNGIVRRDGSSRFGSDYSFGNFGSIGGAWIFTNEAFLKESNSFLSFGKLKANWGVTGNDAISDYLYLSLFSTNSVYQGQTTLRPLNPSNPKIRWETTQKLDIGLDLGLFSDRLLLTSNFYFNTTNNQLAPTFLPSNTGFTNFLDNIPARIDMKGWEFELTSNNLRKRDFSWKTSLNLTIPRTKIVSISPDYTAAATLPLGYPLTQIRGYIFDSIDPATGVPLYQTAAGGTTTTPTLEDEQWIGNTQPKFYGGISNDFQYKGFSFSFFIEVMSRDGYTNPVMTSLGGANFNLSPYFLEGMWQQPGDIATIPKATNTPGGYPFIAQSTFGFEDNTYAKLRNMSAAYSLPIAWTNKIHVKNARLFVNAQNVFVWSKSKYVYDPETGLSTPPLRVITLGISASL
ncbi:MULTISPECIES: SusC/RagA family TonB-linked outer membrane protein [Sphingobacterium]|nr:SusC/RagA family TonB-linked outer membrane protein [Sphingobacterium sp. CFCC 11742]